MFRDRRYEFKNLTKKWKDRMEECRKAGDTNGTKEAKDLMALYESL